MPNASQQRSRLPAVTNANNTPKAMRGQWDISCDLEEKIRVRIDKRLGDRVRDLTVRIDGDRIVLGGQCSTYYSKQLAQHAALGVIEDEHLDNAIQVGVLPSRALQSRADD
jgi:hypothetical protein